MADMKISDLGTASQVNETDNLELSQGDSVNGFNSVKATILAIANKILTGINFTSALQTTDKTITGAINEALQDSGNKNVAEEFDSTATYDVGDYCIYDGSLYVCTTAVTTAGDWDSTDWTETLVMDELSDVSISSIEEIGDVLVSSKANEQGLFYDSTSQKWKNKNPQSLVAVNITPTDYTNLSGNDKENGKIYFVNPSDYENVNYSKFSLAGMGTQGQIGSNFVELYRSDDYAHMANYQGKLPTGLKKIKYDLTVSNSAGFGINQIFVSILSQQGSGVLMDTSHRITYKQHAGRNGTITDQEIDVSSYTQDLYLQLAVVKNNNVKFTNIRFYFDTSSIPIELYFMNKKYCTTEKDYTEVSGTLTAGQTSVTLSDASITTSSTIDVYTDADINYNSVSVSTGSVTITFDEQNSNVGVKVRVS